MKKVPTIFVRDWEGTLGPPARFVTREQHPDCGWVFAGEGVATRKLDGSCCLVRDGKLYKRHEVKAGKARPDGFELLETDEETGARVGWVPVGDGPEDRWHREAFEAYMAPCGVLVSTDGEEWQEPGRLEGTFELLGPKVQGNAESAPAHMLIAHEAAEALVAPRDFDGLRAFLEKHDIEGIVWHHPDGRMAKIKGKDFGIKRAGA